MTYRVEFGGGAQAQFHTRAARGRDALIERAVEFADQPWDAAVRPPGTDSRLPDRNNVKITMSDKSAEFSAPQGSRESLHTSSH